MKNSQQVVLVENTINLFLDFFASSFSIPFAVLRHAAECVLSHADARADGQTDAMTSLHHVTSAGINSGRRAWIERRGDRCVQCGGTEWIRRRRLSADRTDAEYNMPRRRRHCSRFDGQSARRLYLTSVARQLGTLLAERNTSIQCFFCKRIFSGTHILIFDWRPQYSTFSN